jgi:hypothetical protein
MLSRVTARRLVATASTTARLTRSEVNPLCTGPDAVLTLEGFRAANSFDRVEMNAGSVVHDEGRENRATKLHAGTSTASLGPACTCKYLDHEG